MTEMEMDGLVPVYYKSKDYGRLMLRWAEVMLRIILIWPDTDHYKLLLFSCVTSSLASIYIFCGIIAYAVKYSNEFEKVSYALFMMAIPLLPILKIPVLGYKSKQLKKLIHQISTDFLPYDILDTIHTNSFNIIYKVMFYFMTTLITLAILFSLVIWIQPQFMSEKTLPFPCALPSDFSNKFIYVSLYILHAISVSIIVIMSNGGTNIFILGVGLRTANQMYILRKCFQSYNTSDMGTVIQKLRTTDKKDVAISCANVEKEYLLRCVKHHNMLIRFIKDLNDAFSPFELGHLFLTVFGVSIGAYVASRDDVSKFQRFLGVLYVIAYLFQLGYDCVTSTELWYQASLLPECIFKSNWNSLQDESLKKDLLFVLHHSQKFLVCTVYGLYDLNTTLFIKVLKVTFSAYTVLSTASTVSK
uniref:Odorant receptor n=1 Tax=Diabrotica virgifera virgifera TaxID=50390 RepID=A0A6P7FAZ6_DIAVI